MKTRIFLIALIVVILVSQLNAQPWWGNTCSYKYLDINNINLTINNIGGLSRSTDYSFWEQNSKQYQIVYDHGPWVVGKINGIIHLAFEQWRSSYSPGPIINNDAAMNVHPEDSAKYRVYKIGLVDTLNGGKDYLEWPSEYGAEINKYSYPVIYDHQIIWTCYNSLDSTINDRKVWNNHLDTLPVMPIEIHQTAYASEWGLQSWLKDVVFFEWTIINKGSESIDSAYFGLWADIDIYYSMANYPAVDTSIQLGYCWCPLDSSFINRTPYSVGYILKHGPVIPSQGDSAVFKGRKKNNYKNLQLTSFHGISDDAAVNPLTRPALSRSDAWNFVKGLDGNGNIIIDPTSGLETKFPFSGDPVTERGWLCNYGTGGGAGLVMFSGPFTFAPQDTQWVMVALLASTGENYKDAVSKLRQKANIILNTPYESLVIKYSASPPPVVPPQQFTLSQNYPNPFNNQTKIVFDIPYRSRVLLKVYDILGSEVTVILNEELEGNHYEIAFDGSELASGVYFYQIFAKGEQAGYYLQTRKMVLIK